MTQYIGNEPFFGFIKAEEHISVGGTQYTLGRVAPSTASIEVVVNGVVKRPSEYTLTGKTLTLAGVPVDDVVMVRFLTTTGTHSTYTQTSLADDIVTSSKILDGAVTNDHIVSVDASKLTGGFGGSFHQDTFTGDGTTFEYTLTQDVVVVNNSAPSIIVTVSGIHQFSPDHYTLSGTGNRIMTFNTAPADTILITVQYLGLVTDIGVPSGGTLTPSMFSPGTIPVKNSTNPTATSAETNGYPIGTEWINTTDGNIFILTDATVGANVWLGMSQRFDTLGSMVGGQRGAVITCDANGNWVVLAPGSAGQKLTSGGFNKDASWVGGFADTLNNKTITYSVTVDSNKYAIDTVSQDSITLYEGNTYKFDTANGSNAGHTLKFATAADAAGSTEYTTGVTEVGTPGSVGAYTQIVVAAGAPDLYYYCSNHVAMGGTASTTSNILVDSNNDYIVDTSSIAKTVQLPASPSAGDVIKFIDKTGSWDTNKFTINRNGKNINRQAYDLVLESGSMIELVYASATDGWVQTDTDGADWKHLVFADGVVTTTYAASAYDSGDRTSDITATESSSQVFNGEPPNNLVDGGLSANSTDGVMGQGANAIAGKWVNFEWETKQIITEMTFWNNETDTVVMGTWQWQGSNDGTNYTNIGAEWDWNNTSYTSDSGNYKKVYTELSANTTGYKHYRMLGVSGTVTNTSWWLELYFKTQNGTDSTPTYDAITNTSYMIDTTAGAFTVKLPANPAINDYVDFTDQATKFATNKLTVGRNGKNIQTLAEDLEINVANTSTRLTYTGTTNGWVLS
jgi:hypothetical protein